MSVQLRTLKASDRPLLEGILRSDTTFRDDEISVALELVDDALGNAKSDYWFRLAERDGQAAGYICFGPTPMTKSTYDLYWIVVDAKHRGQGIARALIADMEQELGKRGDHAQIRVETSQSEGYGAARKLYENLGYPETGRFKDFYSPGDDLIVFYKSL